MTLCKSDCFSMLVEIIELRASFSQAEIDSVTKEMTDIVVQLTSGGK